MSRSLNSLSFEITGLKELSKKLDQIAVAVGDKTMRSKILIPAVTKAMEPVLAQAKQNAPKGATGILENSLYLTARRPTRKDRRSMYITETDSVVAIVSTKIIPKKLKNQFTTENADLINAYTQTRKGSKARLIASKNLRTAQQKFYQDKGYVYDGRVPAMEFGTKTEFGTARVAARPFLRPAMENNTQTVSNALGEILRVEIDKFVEKNR